MGIFAIEGGAVSVRKLRPFLLKCLAVVAILALIAYAGISIAKEIQNHSKHEGFDSILVNKDFCTLAIEGETLWGGGADGLFKVNMKTMQSTEVGRYSFVRAVLLTKTGLWVGHDGGVSVLSVGAGANVETAKYTKGDFLPDNRVNALMQDSQNNVWIGTWGGAVKYDGKNFTKFTTKEGLLDNMVNVITDDGAGGVWFGSYVAPRGGISVLRDSKWQYFTTKDALLHANVNTIIRLKDGTMFAGGGLYTQGSGVFFENVGDSWARTRTLTKADGIAGEKVRSSFEDSRRRLWVGSEYDGAVVGASKNGPFTKFDDTSGLPSNEVKKIVEDASGNIWFGTRRGIVRIK